MDSIISLCEASMQKGVGVTLYLEGHSISLVVTKVEGTDHVEGRNQTHDRIVVLLSAVVAAAMA